MKVFLVLACAVFAFCAAGPINVDPNKNEGSGGGVDLSGTDLTTKFCQSEGKRCKAAALETKFAGTARQCLVRCAKNKQCLSAFYSKDKKCSLLKDRCSKLANAKGGLDLYRLKKGEECPAGRPEYSGPKVNYSNGFCMLWGKRCPGRDLYPKPQNLKPYMKCLEKCARIKTCGMADFRNNKCELKELSCDESELVDDPNGQNFLRLKAGETKCTGGRSPPGPKPPVTPPKPVEPPVIPVPPQDKYCVRKFANCLFRDIQIIPFVFSFEQCTYYCDANDDCKSLHYGPFGGCFLKRSACTNDGIVPAFGTDAVRVSGNADCSPYNPTYNYRHHNLSNCMFGDIALYLFTPSVARCQYYCNYKSNCKSFYFDHILRTCFLKSHVCPGWFKPLLPAIGHYAVKL